MSSPERAVWLIGDLDDPWVAEIAAGVAGLVGRTFGDGRWPDEDAKGIPPVSTLVLHRMTLSAADIERLVKLRTGPAPARVLLCLGPHARYADLERWSGLVDAVLSEATARETIARHLAAAEGKRDDRPAGPRPRVDVVSSNFELRETLAEACRSAGYPAESLPSWSEEPPNGLVLWDVPVLEPGWAGLLARRSAQSTVIALMGFADRTMVAEARAHGASACLDLPCDLADLVFVLDRLAARRGEPAHEVPPPPVSRRRPSRTVADADPGAYN